MIDTIELRRLAMNATPGPWIRVFSDKKTVKKFKTISGRDVTWVSDCLCPTTGLSEKVAAEHIDEHGGSHFADIEPDHWRAGADASFIAAANPATVLALLDELDRLRTDCNHVTSMFESASQQLSQALELVEKRQKMIDRLQHIESAARNLDKVKDRHNSEIAMNQLLEALK